MVLVDHMFMIYFYAVILPRFWKQTLDNQTM